MIKQPHSDFSEWGCCLFHRNQMNTVNAVQGFQHCHQFIDGQDQILAVQGHDHNGGLVNGDILMNGDNTGLVIPENI